MAWLEEEEKNKRSFFQLKEVVELQQNGLYPSGEEIQESKERLFAKIRALDKNQKRRLGRKAYLLVACRYAAVAVVAMCFVLGIQFLLREREPETVAYSELAIESGPRMGYMILPDSTRVTLNASSKLRFPTKFDKHLRLVYLDGEGYFEVKKNEKVPFVVRSDKLAIEVLGTTFNVMDYSADDYAITTLKEGAIHLETICEDGTLGNSTVLQPNQQVFFHKGDNEFILSDIQIDENKVWINKIFHFNDLPLSMIMSRLEKLYGLSICIANERLKDIRFTGTFRSDQDIEEVLHIINFEKQFSYTITDHDVRIE